MKIIELIDSFNRLTFVFKGDNYRSKAVELFEIIT